MIRSLLVTLAGLLVVQSFGFTSDAAAQQLPWNQEVVTARAGELEDAVGGLRDVVRASPNLQIPNFRRKMYQILDNLRLIEQSATSLHAALRNGAGMEETLPTYKRLQQIRRDTEVLSKQVDITAVTQPKLDKARDLLAKIEPYYPEEPLSPVGARPKAK